MADNGYRRSSPSFVRIKSFDAEIWFCFFFAAPGRAQPATVGLPASGSAVTAIGLDIARANDSLFAKLAPSF
jgi:hypothetical protein